MQLSCVVVTKNRPESLLRLLGSLASQSFSDFEVIVVNDGGEAFEEDFFQEVSSRVGFKLLHNPKSRGSGKSRNQGVQEALGEVILLLDDDIEIVSPHFLEKGLVPFKDPGVGLVFPRKTDVSGNGSEDLSYFKESLSGELHGCTLSEILKLQALGEKIYGPMVSFVRRQAFLDVGGYDFIFGWGIGHSFREESDFQSRVQNRGWKVALSTDIFFNHHIQRKGGHGRNDFKKIFWIAHNQFVFGARHEKLWPIKPLLFTGLDLPRYAWGSGRLLTYPAGLLGAGVGAVTSLFDFIKSKSRRS